MSIAAKVRGANSPQAAIIAIAEGLDQLLDAVTTIGHPEIDPWGGWQAADTSPAALRVGVMEPQQVNRSAEINVVEKALAAEADPENRRALEARLSLLKDTGRPPVDPLAEGDRVMVTEDEVVFPAARPERRHARATFAATNPLHDMVTPKLSEQEMIAAFSAGGPLWLYHYDRSAILGMPEDWRRGFVADVVETSPREAAELSRDILKDLAANGQEVTLEGLSSETDA